MAHGNYPANKYSIVDSLPLFSNLSFIQKGFIASRCQIEEYNKSDVICEEGSPPDYFYCVIVGRIQLYHPADKSGKRKSTKVECLRKGDYFSSVAALTGHPYGVSARALNDSALLRIDRKSFNEILHKIPRLAVLLSHHLSRRLSHAAPQEVFETTILAVYGARHIADASDYASVLAEGIRKESGKKVTVVQASSLSSKREVSSRLSALTGDYHYVLIAVPQKLNAINFEILKQADICHIISPPGKVWLRRTALVAKRLENLLGREAEQAIFVLIKEDKPQRAAARDYATLPGDKQEYKKVLRRVAREISGVRVGLALSSGAAMGFAHIGVLAVLEKEHVPIDVVAGTSMGALIGALWAAGYPAAEIERIALGVTKVKTMFWVDPTFPVKGLIKGRTIRKMLRSYFGDKTFFDTRLPLRIIACDIKTRREFVIDKGKLVDAVMASIAIPGIFEPMEYGSDVHLVDGGIANPLPVSVLSREGIKRIIAVNVLPSPEDILRIRQRRLNIYDVIVNSYQAMEYAMAEVSARQADIRLHPLPTLSDWYEFYKADVFIKAGREHTRKALPEIKKLVKK